MTDVTAISAQAAALLVHYSFDISGDTVEELVGEWLTIYPAYWLRLAVVEALYQGRYKTVSVEHILAMWQRRGQPLYHFNHEFERLVCSIFSLDSIVEEEATPPQEEIDLSAWEPPLASELPPRISANINQEESGEGKLKDSRNEEVFPILNWTGEGAENTSNQEVISKSTSDESDITDNESGDIDPSSQPVKHTDFYTKLKAVVTEAKRNNER
ncbi:MAG TPA: hypothetical protein VK211_02415 [Kamptonema sp.]|nr:hypothetical protein [Kamptonema sp.]